MKPTRWEEGGARIVKTTLLENRQIVRHGWGRGYPRVEK
jgi:hypothetical protein